MTPPDNDNRRRLIPAVDEVLARAEIANLRARHPNFLWTRLVREAIEEFRATPSIAAADREAIAAWVEAQVRRRVGALQAGGLRRVLNGTGVVLHTNLGRAVVDHRAVAAAEIALSRYVSLEVDLASGERSKRGIVLEDLVAIATGAEAAMVVNNNAAAVYLIASTFSPPGRVIVSRGELVEIGGSFRLPEILRHAAREVVEVGTTNRTYAGDYAAAARKGDLILKVHKSNYAIEGFAHEATAAELAQVAGDVDCALVYDLGSGALVDCADAGLGDDPDVADILAAGPHALTMSGDKLLGGVQAGIIVGNASLIARLKQNPLRRALRIDKVTIAAMQEVLRAYLFDPDRSAAAPILSQIFASVDDVRERANRVTAALDAQVRSRFKIDVCDDAATVGGGSLAGASLAGVAVRIRCADDRDAARVARALRLHDLPLFARVRAGEVRVNLCGILEDEDEELAGILNDVLGSWN